MWAPRLESPEPRGRLLMPFLFRDAEVARVRDIPYVEGAGPRQHLDVYTPRDGARGAPVLLQIHGGGWTIGNKRQQALPLMMHLARRGWVCVAANYRLSPSATFPDHLIDVKQALRWIRQHIAEYGGDPGFVAITGGSAGGHLSALAALTANRPEFQPGFETIDTSVQAAVPFYGAYDFTNSQNHAMGAGLRGFRRADRAEEEARERTGRPSIRPRRCTTSRPTRRPSSSCTGRTTRCSRSRRRASSRRGCAQTSRAPVVFAELEGAQHAFELFHSPRTHHVIRGVHRFLGTVYSEYLQAIGAARGRRRRSPPARCCSAAVAFGCARRLRLLARDARNARGLRASPRRSASPSRPSTGRSTSRNGCPRSTPASRARPSGPAVALLAWPASPGHVGVRTRSGDPRRWDCVSRTDGGAVERFDAVPPPEKHPAESSPLFSRTPLEPPTGSCYDHERAFAHDGRFLGWLSYDVCG